MSSNIPRTSISCETLHSICCKANPFQFQAPHLDQYYYCFVLVDLAENVRVSSQNFLVNFYLSLWQSMTYIDSYIVYNMYLFLVFNKQKFALLVVVEHLRL